MLFANSLVLVCILPEPRDLEIARVLGWYRIPLRTAPKLILVDYLAFYQPSSFGKSGNCIRYIAEVKGNELTTRGELLRDEPNHPRSGEEYYKLQLGPLELLDHPITARSWKRLTFLYTTGEYLLQAESINDLVVRSVERKQLWNALRERSTQDQIDDHNGTDLEIDDAILALILGYGSASGSPKDL